MHEHFSYNYIHYSALLCNSVAKACNRKMAALLGARSGLPEFFTSADSRPNPVVAAFEKELGSFIASLKRVEKRATTAQSRQKA